MGIYDRDYQASPARGSGYGGGGPGGVGLGGFSAWTVNTWIIVVNCVIHAVALTVFAQKGAGPGGGDWSVLHSLGHFSTFEGFQRLQVWRLVTFQFLHSPDTIFHILFNMFGMWVFGPMVENALGRKRYLAFYLTCGIGGGLLYLLLNLIGLIGLNLPGALDVSNATPLVGASAGVFGVIVACAYIAPEARVQLLFPPIPLKMKWMAYGYVGLAVFNLLTGGSNAGGDAAHIGGAIAGFFFIRNPHHLVDFFDVFNDSRPKSGDAARGRRSRPPRKARAASSDEVDRILDKVSRKGIQSLTAREKKILEKASRER
ncbi:MAG: rhomboid family intramembrane serine protease [Planctomycetota bacterium]